MFSLVFALVHASSTPALFGVYVVLALLMGWLVWRTAGIEASIAFHSMFNVTSFVGTLLLGQDPGEQSEPSALTLTVILGVSLLAALAIAASVHLGRAALIRYGEGLAVSALGLGIDLGEVGVSLRGDHNCRRSERYSVVRNSGETTRASTWRRASSARAPCGASSSARSAASMCRNAARISPTLSPKW